jgi:hypothetical protein
MVMYKPPLITSNHHQYSSPIFITSFPAWSQVTGFNQPWVMSENFWKVWQSAGTRPRLTEKVQVTSLT